MANNGFDKIATVYDILARMVYGKSIVDSQKYFLSCIPNDAKVLILGGGTGWILSEIEKNKTVCEIWYIDASEKMINLSKRRAKRLTTHFVKGTEHDIPPAVKFDVVITNFYVDLFSDEHLTEVLIKIKSSLVRNAKWIVTDFIQSGKWWQIVLLKSMYVYFNLICAIEAKKLPQWNVAMRNAGMMKRESKLFYWQFIETTLYTVC